MNGRHSEALPQTKESWDGGRRTREKEKAEMEYEEEKKKKRSEIGRGRGSRIGRGRREGGGSCQIGMESLLSDPNNKNQQEGMNEGGAHT